LINFWRPALGLALLATMIAGEGLAQPRGAAPQAAPPASGSRGENFSAGKSPAQLFASDCTGAGCHRGPQGLAKDRGQLGLAGFLREHYTNSRESAAALAAYLASAPAGDARTRQQAQPDQPGSRTPRQAARPDDAVRPPEDVGPRTRRQPGTPATSGTPGEPADIAQPEPARPAPPPARGAQRGRQATAAPPPEPAAAPPPPPPPPPPPQRHDFDIMD
jgi:hypothetical protein